MLHRLKLGEKEIILVGTAHISKESIALVDKTIDEEQPDVVGVELDQERLHQLLSGKKWGETNIVEVVKTGKTYLFLLNILLSNMQKQLGAQVGVQPGAEMMEALKKAQEKKIVVQLLDRDIKITLKRAFNEMKFTEKAKLGMGLLAGFFGYGEKITPEKIEELKQEDLLNKLMKELGKQMPSMKKVLVDERDSYIAEMIRNSPGKKIVAVVGAGHIDGIVECIKSHKKVNMAALTTMPKKKNYLKWIGYAIPILFAIGLIYGFSTKGVETTLKFLGIWILTTGGFAAIGAIISRAHPLSIITAFAAAPMTTLHPALAAGWFSALVETKYHPPRVMDFESLSNVSSITGFYRNKVTHILIVAALTNIGAMIGVVIALPALVSLLA